MTEKRNDSININRHVALIRWFYVSAIIAAIVYITLPHIAGPYVVSLAFMLFVHIAYAQGWNIMSGLTGYVNFGYSMFSGIAGYVSVILIIDYNVWWPIGWILGALGATLIAIFFGCVMLRLRGSYFAIGMLALLLGIKLLASSKYLAPATRGGYGFSFIEPLSMNTMYYCAGVVAGISIYACYRILKSSFGTRLLAIREDEEAAGSLGINATADKIAAFAMSAFFGGLMGAIHTAFANYLEPDTAFSTQWTIVPIVMVLLGGPGTVWGPVLGAIILTFVEELFWSFLPGAYMMLYALVMIGFVLWMPKGIIETLKKSAIIPKVRSI